MKDNISQLCTIGGMILGIFVGVKITSDIDNGGVVIFGVLAGFGIGAWLGYMLGEKIGAALSENKENSINKNTDRPLHLTTTKSNYNESRTNTSYRKNISDFSKGKNYNPDKQMLGNLSVNQKKSVINLLYLIARSDGNFSKEEIDYLNTFDLGYSVEECSAYLNLYGNSRTLNDLKQLTSSQKDYLLTTAFELMCCDGKPNEKEMSDFVFAFEELGYTQDGIANTIEKFALLRKKFM